MEKLYTVAQIAGLTNQTRQAVYQKIFSRKAKFQRVGGNSKTATIVIPSSELSKFYRERALNNPVVEKAED